MHTAAGPPATTITTTKPQNSFRRVALPELPKAGRRFLLQGCPLAHALSYYFIAGEEEGLSIAFWEVGGWRAWSDRTGRMEEQQPVPPYASDYRACLNGSIICFYDACEGKSGGVGE